MRFQPVQIITNGDMSQGTVASNGINLNQEIAWCIQAVWSGTPSGTFTIQISNDLVPVVSGPDPSVNVTNWITFSNSGQTSGGAPGSFMWISDLAPYTWVRLLYTRNSGTGTLNAIYAAKG